MQVREKAKVHWRQLMLTPTYVFTDYKAQGQTMQPVIVDLGRTLTGKLNQFNAYVTMLHRTQHLNIRLLRDFDIDLFTMHPDQDLMESDMQLEVLNELTRTRYNLGEL
jgi:hypothetical protein